jgi:hypothetical protein
MKKSILLSYAASLALVATPANAADDKEVGILAALGLTAASGKTELGEGAGKLEGTMLVSPLLRVAAEKIVAEKTVKADAGGTSGVLLVDDEEFDIAGAEVLDRRLTHYLAKVPTACQSSKKGGSKILRSEPVDGGDSEKSNGDAQRILTAAIGALKVDTSIKGFSTTITSKSIASAIARLQSGLVQPSLITSLDDTNPIVAHLSRFEQKRAAFAACPDKEANKDILAGLDKSIDALLSPGAENTPSAYLRAARVFQMKKDGSWPRILKVRTIEAGGTLINRSNIFLQFGFPGAVQMQSGMVVEFTLSDPTSGEVKQFDQIVCRLHRAVDLSKAYAMPKQSHFDEAKGKLKEKYASCVGSDGK